jgi:hypothetical protein
LQPAQEDFHLLGRLDVTARFRHLDAVVVGVRRRGALASLGQRLAQRLPRRGIIGIAVDGGAEAVRRLARRVRLQVLVAQREAQQGAVARPAKQFLQGFDAWVHGSSGLE